MTCKSGTSISNPQGAVHKTEEAETETEDTEKRKGVCLTLADPVQSLAFHFVFVGLSHPDAV